MLLYILLLLYITTVDSISYCGARMCSKSNAHTFCQFPEGANPQCTGYINAPLTREEIARLLARFNRRRSEAAIGSLRGVHPAGDMMKLRWVEELAREAQRWADQCRPPRIPEEQDLCRDLYSTTVGQCVASVVGEAPGLHVESMVDLWYMQARHYKGRNVTYYKPPQKDGPYYGDFAQIIWSKTYMVGCGRSRFMREVRGRYRTVERLVCNFAPRGPEPARPLWSLAAPGTSCPAGAVRDKTLTVLCNYQPNIEINDNDQTMTINEQLIVNTVLEIEGNETLNYFGSLDELYLTKMAMITMKEMVSVRSNSLQKRDVAEVILIEDAKAELPLQDLNNDINIHLESEAKGDKETTAMVSKKLNLIGRPKSYNMEELNDVFEDRTENEKLTNKENDVEKELYGDYELQDENKHTKSSETPTSNTDITTEKNNTKKNNKEKYQKKEEKKEMTSEEDNSTHAYNTHDIVITNEVIIKKMEDIVNKTIHGNINTGANDTAKNNIDDYLSDSETVQELQKALEQMERNLAPQSSVQRKVRREIRETTISNAETNSEGNSKTAERGPMMGMILKYMPYLKDYENALIGPVNNGAGLVPCSRCAVMILMLFVNVY